MIGKSRYCHFFKVFACRWLAFGSVLLTVCLVNGCGKKAEDLAVVAYDEQDNQLLTYIDPQHSNDTLDLSLHSSRVEATLFTQKGDYFFGVDEEKKCLVRYKKQAGKVTEDGRVQLPPEKWHRLATWFDWIDEHTLLLGSTTGGKLFTYSVVDTDKMELKVSEPLDIPKPSGQYYYGGVLGRLVDNRLYVGYMLYKFETSGEPAGDTIYLATIDYPSMKTLSISKDTRSTFPGGYMINWNVSFVENGDVYFIAQPGERLRPRPGKAPRLFRISKNASDLDADYNFPLSTTVDEEVYGLFYLGNGKALVKSVRKDDIKEFSDYWGKDIVSYFLIDVHKKTKLALKLPKGRLGLTSNICQQNGKTLIAIPSQKSSTLWELNPSSGETKKLLTMKGAVEQLFPLL